MIDALEFTINLAVRTGDLLKEYFNPGGLRASQKSDSTIVTEADLAADKFITEAIREQFPLDEIISEESSHPIDNPLASIWIIDPLDGTTNFSLGLPVWGISIAQLADGYPQLGVLYFPLISELYIARRGSGALLNRVPITTRAPDPSQPMSFFSCCSRTFRHYNISIPYKPRIMGSTAYSLCMVARGSALLGFDATPKIWDLAAAWLLVEEAGGMIAAFEGPPPFPFSAKGDFTVTSYPTLAAATPGVFDFGHKKIQKK